MKKIIPGVAAVALGLSVTIAGAQTVDRPVVIEARGGVAVPTFDITDLAKTGPVFGGSIGFGVNPRILVLGELDCGRHGGADFMDTTGPDVDVNHYVAKAGYLVHESDDGRLRILVNAGAGVVTFKADAPDAETNSCFAINAGAKLYWTVNEAISIVASPQGGISFVDKDDGFTGSTARVWPFTARLALSS